MVESQDQERIKVAQGLLKEKKKVESRKHIVYNIRIRTSEDDIIHIYEEK